MSAEEIIRKTRKARGCGGPQGAFHQPRQPRPHCLVNPDNLWASAYVLSLQVATVARNNKGEGSLVFVSDRMQAYVIPENRPAAEQWTRERFRWLMGFYRPREDADHVAATPEGIEEDLREHLQDLARG